MIIRSQDKYSIMDDMNISICKERPATVGDYKGENIYTKSGVFLGHYSTEEKAIKVLDMICEEYKKPDMWAEYSCNEMIIHNKTIFQMPQDSEV